MHSCVRRVRVGAVGGTQMVIRQDSADVKKLLSGVFALMDSCIERHHFNDDIQCNMMAGI